MVSKSAKKPFDLHVVFLFNVVRDYMPGWLKRDILYWVSTPSKVRKQQPLAPEADQILPQPMLNSEPYPMVSKSAKKPFDLHVVFLFNVVRDYMPGWLKRDILYWVSTPSKVRKQQPLAPEAVSGSSNIHQDFQRWF
eukprot:CAMPEP_0184755074 /NCGR_PEP_ID=MMETSP0315-20130426/44957_1 /TAXON_ID=101924 /ORGANISM="Rhodosorus marinus, Strain UTEX LB 2760" /LENGTH=136 /DNA_ID=CAMNT_0027234537 /DNA_START=617 /DNA_END=1027 /DNA_ORIENTATION=+